MIHIKKGYSFDDLLLVPKFSTIKHRSSDYIDTSVDLGKGINLKVPIVSSNMKHVTEEKMATTIASLGGLALLHRFDEQHILKTRWKSLVDLNSNVGVSVGVKYEDLVMSEWYLENDAKIICVDVAHADAFHVHQFVKQLRKLSDDFLLIVGNIVTFDAKKSLAKIGVDIIKVGIGNGSSCTTRAATGCGVPQMTALMDVFERNDEIKVIADGGIQKGADIVKALCFADAVMIGNLFAGTNESPGSTEIVLENGVGKLYKPYHGSSTLRERNIEGHKGKVLCTGPVNNVVNTLMQGLMSGMSYQDASNLAELKKDPTFVEITSAGIIESNVHNIL